MNFGVEPFTSLQRIQFDGENILHRLQEDGDGNQWIIIVALDPSTIEKLSGKEQPLGGLNYRFQFQGSVGLMKFLPEYSDTTANHLIQVIDRQISVRENPPRENMWSSLTMYKVAPNQGKQGDRTLLPWSRCSPQVQPCAWPTLVIETGVPDSLLRLRQNAKWWFNNSKGDVRIVLIVIMSKANFRLEKWQLAPPGSPQPLTSEYMNFLRSSTAHVPLIQQDKSTQQPFPAQVIEVTPSGPIGAPLVLPFNAMYDEPARPGEGDIFIGSEELTSLMNCIL
jgi:hypothetical protein